MLEKLLIVLGAGGLGVEAIWVAEEMNAAGSGVSKWKILGFVDDNPSRRGERVSGYEVLGTPEEVSKVLKDTVYFHCAVGKNKARQKAVRRLLELGWTPATLIHPNTSISRLATVGAGTYVGAGSVLAPNSRVGDFVIINTHVGVGHDSFIDDYVQLCPGVRIGGACRIDKFAFIGSNASVQPGVRVEEGSTVGANSLAIRKVEPLVTVIGVPARVISRPAKNESPA